MYALLITKRVNVCCWEVCNQSEVEECLGRHLGPGDYNEDGWIDTGLRFDSKQFAEEEGERLTWGPVLIGLAIGNRGTLGLVFQSYENGRYIVHYDLNNKTWNRFLGSGGIDE